MKPASVLLRKQIGLLRPLISADIEACRKTQDRIGMLGAKVLSGKVDYRVESNLSFPAEYALPTHCNGEGIIMYLHGGGYTAGGIEYARGFGGVIANALKLKTLCVAYSLAPENPFPGALEDVLAAYKLLVADHGGRKIALVGESAGGGLCYSLCLAAKERGIELPACISVISPWTDLTLSFPSHAENAGVDPMLSTAQLELYAKMYAGELRKNPLASPVFGDMSGIPDSQIFVGSYEILLDDSIQMSKRLEECGCKCSLHIEDGAWHAYVLYGIHEAKDAIEKIGEFIRGYIG